MTESLAILANGYRECFETLKDANADEVFLRNFPAGCCSLASEIMCSHLRMLGVEADYVGGEAYEGDGSHSWVVCSGMVIDITADQFDSSLPRVYLGEGLPLHSQYDVVVMDVRLDCYDNALLDEIETKLQEIVDSEEITQLFKKK